MFVRLGGFLVSAVPHFLAPHSPSMVPSVEWTTCLVEMIPSVSESIPSAWMALLACWRVSP